jgi:hypothetical protein
VDVESQGAAGDGGVPLLARGSAAGVDAAGSVCHYCRQCGSAQGHLPSATAAVARLGRAVRDALNSARRTHIEPEFTRMAEKERLWMLLFFPSDGAA